MQFLIQGAKHHAIPMNNLFFMLAIPFAATFELTYALILFGIAGRLADFHAALKRMKFLQIDDIKLTMNVFERFYDIIFMMNDVFSLNSLIGLMELSIHTTLTAFSVYQMAFRSTTLENQLFCFIGIAYLATKGSIYVTLTVISTIVRRKGNDIWIEINRRVESVEKVIKFQEIAVSHMRCHELVPRCGVYEIDWRIIFAILTATMSYLTILVQFDVNMS